MEKKFSKEMKIMKKVKMLEMKASINQMKNTVNSIISQQDQTEKRISELRTRSRRYCTQTTAKEKTEYDYNIQELWDTIKRPNLKIHKVEE
jgi:phage shock protein A